MNKKTPIVIAVAAVSGGGKTTIATGLKTKLDQSEVLSFDAYDFEGPDDMIEWIENGCTPDEWDLTPLIRDIKKLLDEPLDYIILDFPFAYLHNETREFIDYAVFIETPLDIALARRIIRDFQNRSSKEILVDLENYMLRGKSGYISMLNSVKPSSDLIVDGTLPKSVIVNNIIANIKT
ncbi:hypothetical protein NQ095_13040 [Rossellomorea sp. SC111]|uniref:hypothetical protein n=1 Tax=Rossellomorea sp. SC111 TaxID=2968985 RepID=UPI00215A7C68|nr:hypothetical protein [Rossellomorea sp. SC111]MCR8849340.1 hypothetical protein [Rossellomorea sp. SC111]